MSFSIIRGDDHVLKVSITTQADVAVDITGDLIFFTIKLNTTDTDAAAVHRIDEYVKASADATAGIHKFKLPTNLPVGVYNYDIQLKRVVSGANEVSTIEISTFSVTQDITIGSTKT